jgi:hypothetical protein
VNTQRHERLPQRLRAQTAPTPPSTLSDPDRKPLRSTATR